MLKGKVDVFLMSNLSHVVSSSEHKKWRRKNWVTYGHFGIRIFYCQFENVQSNWLNRLSGNSYDRPIGGLFSCSENFVTIRPLRLILQAKIGQIDNRNMWYVLLLPLWKCTAKLVRSIELKFSGSSKWRIVRLFIKFRHDMTPLANITGQ